MTSPPTAAATGRPRTAVPIVKAQSAPGTTISRIATAQKVSTETKAMGDSFQRGSLALATLCVIGRQVVPSFLSLGTCCGKIYPVDRIDRKILAELQADGRLTITDLAARVGLSVSPCHRRLRELERSGVIRGYRAVVDPAAVGLGFEALLFATLRQADRETISTFERAAADIPYILQVQRLFGDPDYLLRIVSTDLAAFQRLYDDKLSALPGVQRLTSTLVMKHVVTDRPLPA